MADNRKRFALWLSFKDLKILKHALEYYLEREGSHLRNIEQDKREESELLERVVDRTSNIVE